MKTYLPVSSPTNIPVAAMIKTILDTGHKSAFITSMAGRKNAWTPRQVAAIASIYADCIHSDMVSYPYNSLFSVHKLRVGQFMFYSASILNHISVYSGDATAIARCAIKDKLLVVSYARNISMEARDMLHVIFTNPMLFAYTHGHVTGKCCFCLARLDLTTQAAAYGYDAACASTYSLPWSVKTS